MHRFPLALAAVASLLATALVAPVPTHAAAGYEEQTLAAAGNGFANYRIPALTHLGNGIVLAAYDGRVAGNADVPAPNSVVVRRSTDNGTTWGAQQVVMAGIPGTDNTKMGYGDPSFVVDRVTGEVFMFFVWSKRQGFHGSGFGNDDADRNVLSLVYVSSTDGGKTWGKITSLTKVIKNSTMKSGFFTSGEGIQLSYGPHTGRLLQTIASKDGAGAMGASTVYSDDHGKTWKAGAVVGTQMDENKVVELSDGTVMLNSRPSSGPTSRIVTVSTDGGATFFEKELHHDHVLIDPRNNASIIRLNPNAKKGSREARELLFANSVSSTTDRVNGGIRYSCDDGRSWTNPNIFQPAAMAYSTLTTLDKGKIGLLYESDGHLNIRFATIDRSWLNRGCASILAPRTTVPAGKSTTITITVANPGTKGLPAGKLAVANTRLISAASANVPALAPGTSTQVQLPLAVGAGADGPIAGIFRYTAGSTTLSTTMRISAAPATERIEGAAIVGTLTADRDVLQHPYRAGEKIGYPFEVVNIGNVTVDVVPTKGQNISPLVPADEDPSVELNAGNCRYKNLTSQGSYLCTKPQYTVTKADVDRGYIQPSSTWELRVGDQVRRTYTVQAPEFSIRKRTLSLTVSREMPTSIARDTAEFTITTRYLNTGDVPLEVTSANPPDRASSLAHPTQNATSIPARSAVTATTTVRVSDADRAAGRVRIPQVQVRAHNGSLTTTATDPARIVAIASTPGRISTPSVQPTGGARRPPSKLPTTGR